MKSLFVVALLASVGLSSPAAAQKYGALAVDRQNGFAYGFAYDHVTRSEAEARAIEEVAKRNGNGTVVLVWSGEGCGAYRTIDPKDGNAYGWGVAATQAAAEAIADKEVAKRAKGKIAADHVWACNSKQPAKLKVLKDLSAENFRTVTIGGQTWTAENVSIAKFRNGDPIPKAASYDEFRKLTVAKKPGSYCFATDKDCSKYGRFYNLYAVMDPRGFAPQGWAVPTADQYQTLFAALGGESGAPARLRSAEGWPDYADPQSDPSGFDALATGYPDTKEPRFNAAYFWTTSSETSGGREYRNHAFISASDGPDEARVGTQSGYEPLSVRLIAE